MDSARIVSTGYYSSDDPIYQNTRRFVLSSSNPYRFEGAAGAGIGGPHIGPDYMRVRIGVDNNKQIPTADYVLGKPSAEDFKILEQEFNQIADNVSFLVKADMSGFLNKIK